jgi:hypothetical protein
VAVVVYEELVVVPLRTKYEAGGTIGPKSGDGSNDAARRNIDADESPSRGAGNLKGPAGARRDRTRDSRRAGELQESAPSDRAVDPSGIELILGFD